METNKLNKKIGFPIIPFSGYIINKNNRERK